MNTMKRILASALAMLTVLSLVACASDSADTDDTTSASADTTGVTETSTEPSRESIADSLPELDFEGKSVKILTREEDPYLGEIYVEEQTGEIVNDAVWQRNQTVTERLNVTIEPNARPGAWGPHNDFMAMVRTNLLAEEVAPYDIISYYAYCNSNFSSQGLLYNLFEVPHLDLDKPWWHQRFIDNAEVYGKLYMLAGDITLTSTSMRFAMFFNKNLVAEYTDTDVYSNVLDGSWTREYFGKITKDVYVDSNGDSTRDVGDLYGFDANLSYDGYATGCGLTYVKKTADGGYEFDLYNPKNEDIIETFYEMLSEKGVWYVDKQEQTRFPDGLSMFYVERLNYADKLREMKDDYGIVPMPKYDESQDDYYTVADDNYSQVMVPYNAGDLELSGAVLELMCAESYKYVTPAYFETTMKDKYLRDDNSIKMLDLIVEGAYYDFAVVNTMAVGFPVFTVRSSMQHHEGKNFATHWAEDESVLTTSLTALLEKFQ